MTVVQEGEQEKSPSMEGERINESVNQDSEPNKVEEVKEQPVEVVVEEEVNPEDDMSPEEKEFREREEYIWRFRILKKKYPEANIQEYSSHSDLPMMKLDYDRKVKELYMDDCTNGYRRYLLFLLMAIEWGCKYYLGLDMGDFQE